MASSLEIRPADPSDADRLIPLVGRLLDEITQATGSAQFQFDADAALATARALLHERKAAALIGWAGALPVGFLTLSPCHALYAGGSFGVITELFVEPAYRGLGIGTELLLAAQSHALDQGWSRLEVTTPPLPAFERTLVFYQRHGFTVTGGRKLKRVL